MSLTPLSASLRAQTAAAEAEETRCLAALPHAVATFFRANAGAQQMPWAYAVLGLLERLGASPDITAPDWLTATEATDMPRRTGVR